MIGIVIVSHSRRLAEGVRELALQMVQGHVPIALAAGIDDPANPLGTDAMQVYEAIASVYSDDGVLVLMDLGSALMSAEMALEFFPSEQQQHIHLCAAPLVEGAIAAVVAASSNSDIQWVITEVQEALVAKATQLGLADCHLSSVISEEPMINDKGHTSQISLTVSNRFGLHARPAAQFVSCAARFQSQIKVRNVTKGSDFVRADSINQVGMLGVRQGDEIVITATGLDAEEALAALQTLVTTNFGEDKTPPPTSATPPTSDTPTLSSLQGIPASPGVAIAPCFRYRKIPITWDPTTSIEELPHYNVDNTREEWQRLQTALHTAQQEIQTLLSHSSIQIGDAEAAIFDAHLLFLADPTLLEASQQRIFTQHLNAEAVWQGVINEVASNYRRLDDPYLQERIADVVDVGQRVLRVLSGTPMTIVDVPQPAILVAADLTPSDTASLDPTRVLGICITAGSATSHTAILARSLGIPAIVGLPPEILQLTDGTQLAIDGETGRVWVKPEPETLVALQTKRDAHHTTQQQAITIAHQPGMTRDRHPINVFANVSSINHTQQAVNYGAEGVGLLRTEFLYLNRTTAPTEEQQLEVYQAIGQILEHRPLIIRTLDIGGDKSIPYLGVGLESNPFLGWRGIRFCLDRPLVLKTQLRAILRASFRHQIKIMFPMIATVAEIQAAKAILTEVQGELRQAGIPFDEAMQIGIMVEVPSAVTIANQLAREVDFFSIGTNDLSQYVMAADRTNPKVANLADALHPAVLCMIQQTVEAAHAAGIWVGLCGEIAADPLAAPILLGLGLDEVSLNPQAIPAFKGAIAQLTMPQAQAIVTAALQQDSATKVREIVNYEL
ncbi:MULTISPECIES: phosphoenolpyruvate--protein phosphotransferase [Fischerella]|uniref:Phosphocarrier protein HPr n=1 Tax=Fischerella muscicola CCMEE 5323 TaxID=2019572 RepID=A0A2N6K4I0_FISMU|nr:phosphoenolpyruvate--protein phosphotransferase [Fischerella muscicola]MBD2431708.1 phosphoenolpyruvate--protein phosphotransferase [Fischerella sp. FACHB-380]PLZ91067.1 HPr family phosphocarrier protein [Fischerella muscicola CCMEE 5323]